MGAEAHAASLDDAIRLVGGCPSPGEAFWRIIELSVVRRWTDVRPPVLELGCGDGLFTELTGLKVDLAVDLESRAVERAARRTGVYREVRRMDVHDLDPELGSFGAIFSNSVLEHVPDVQAVLRKCRELVVPGGRLIVTVPLSEMNHHLAFLSPSYVRARQRQLQHRNLWSLEEWKARLGESGFANVTVDPYLDATACRFWDRLDLPGTIGVGRYRVWAAIHRAAGATLPSGLKVGVERRLARSFLARATRPPDGPWCAALLVATASGE